MKTQEIIDKARQVLNSTSQSEREALSKAGLCLIYESRILQLQRENVKVRELLVEARGYLDRMGQEGVRERIDSYILSSNL